MWKAWRGVAALASQYFRVAFVGPTIIAGGLRNKKKPCATRDELERDDPFASIGRGRSRQWNGGIAIDSRRPGQEGRRNETLTGSFRPNDDDDGLTVFLRRQLRERPAEWLSARRPRPPPPPALGPLKVAERGSGPTCIAASVRSFATFAPEATFSRAEERAITTRTALNGKKELNVHDLLQRV